MRKLVTPLVGDGAKFWIILFTDFTRMLIFIKIRPMLIVILNSLGPIYDSAASFLKQPSSLRSVVRLRQLIAELLPTIRQHFYEIGNQSVTNCRLFYFVLFEMRGFWLPVVTVSLVIAAFSWLAEAGDQSSLNCDYKSGACVQQNAQNSTTSKDTKCMVLGCKNNICKFAHQRCKNR